MTASSSDLQAFAIEFRDALIGTQPRASRMMCAVVSMPLRAALKVLCGVETELVTEDGHTFLVTADGQYRIDPTIDQFSLAPSEKVLVEEDGGAHVRDEILAEIPFVELLEQFKRLYGADGHLGAAEAGSLVAEYVYLPLARHGLADVILPNAVEREIRAMVNEHRRANELVQFKLAPRHKLLLYGPPGNGKTLLAEGMAQDLDLPFLPVKYAGMPAWSKASWGVRARTFRAFSIRGSAGNRAKHLNYCDNSLISRRYLTTLAAGSVVSANNVLSNNGKPELIQCVVYFVPYYVIRYYIPSAPVDVRQNATF